MTTRGGTVKLCDGKQQQLSLISVSDQKTQNACLIKMGPHVDKKEHEKENPSNLQHKKYKGIKLIKTCNKNYQEK